MLRKYIFNFQCLARRFLKEFSVPAVGWQAVPVVYNAVSKKNKKCAYRLVRTVFLCSFKGCPLVPADSYSLNKEQTVS